MTHPVIDWVSSQLKCGRTVALAVVIEISGSVPGKPGARLGLTNLGEMCGTIGGGGLEKNVLERLSKLLKEKEKIQGGFVETFQLYKDAKGKAGTPLNSLCGGRVTLSFEVIQPMPHILICGGGHCGKAIADAAELLAWKYSVFDVREEYANDELYPNAESIHNMTAAEFIEKESGDSLARFSDILLLGHDWKVDEELLIGLLTHQQNGGKAWRATIGVIGSEAKWGSFSETARDAGIEQKYLKEVICPIGLNIGSETPPEIAIAVTAQILARIKSKDPEEATWRD